MNHVLLITSTNLASNPRCLKELQLLYSMNKKISFVGFKYHNWTDTNEALLNSEFNNVNYHYLDATSNKINSWLVSSFMEKFCRKLVRLLPVSIFYKAMAVSKRSWLLTRLIKSLKEYPNLIIAHNPAAFYPAYLLSNKLNVPLAIDIEDFHPGEGKNKYEQNNIIELMKYILPKAVYISYASPLIQKVTEKFIEQPNGSGFVINNCFPENEFIHPDKIVNNGEKLKFVWFSQYIDYSRGLENILPVFDLFSKKLELTLIGDMRTEFYNNEIEKRSYIICKASLTQKDLHASLSQFDIGLAIENKALDVNKNICLSNKLWAYFQSGLFILASDTDGQSSFIGQHNEHGISVQLEEKHLKIALEKLFQNIEQIRSNHRKRFQAAKNFSWELEAEILKSKWQTLLNNAE